MCVRVCEDIFSVRVIIEGNKHGNMSSNPDQGSLHFK